MLIYKPIIFFLLLNYSNMKKTLLFTFLVFAAHTNFATNFNYYGTKNLVTLSTYGLKSKINTLNTPSINTYNISIDKSIKATSGKNNSNLFFVPKIVCEVKLNDFTAYENNVGVKLNWETDIEVNTLKFELQRSVDGVKFETIDTQNTKAEAGNSSQPLTYNYVDKDPQVGTIYYRLKTVYIDKSAPESELNTLSLSLDVANTLIVYPSVVNDELNMRWREKYNDKFKLDIYDVTGKMVLSYTKLKGQSYTANISDLASGVHILKVKDELTNKLIAVRKFIKK
ncbi:MAG: T9SS C-terminal target domain-containing protein [Sphingobacteriales bacterium]|nr:MAG: T9SS C-terminal target domain-containing protein [Sphingobacteriales bacterium]